MLTLPLVSRARALPRSLVCGALAVAALAARPGQATAQDGTGTLLVHVIAKRDSAPLPGAFVRSGRHGAVADSVGWARLELSGGLTEVRVSAPGFRPWLFEITIVPNAPQRVEAPLDPAASDPSRPSIRSSHLPDSAALSLPVQAISDRETDLASELHPAGLERLLDALPSVRPLTGSGPLGPIELRVRGLPGRYTGLLIDGLPVYGAIPGEFRAVQLTNVDLEQVELLTGPAAGLFGPVAPVGAINLISRRPVRDSARLSFSQSSEKGGSVLAWGARRLSPTASASLSGDFHQQRLVDADDDQWGDLPRAIRLQVRPRVALELPNGDELTAFAGGMSEDRTGGILVSTTEDDPYRQKLKTRNFDAGIRASRLLQSGGRLEAKASGFYQATNHQVDDLHFRDRRSSLFLQVTWTGTVGLGSIAAGAGYQRDAFRQRDLEGFDYTHSVPSAFAQLSVPIGAAARLSASARCDRHNVYGTFCSPHGALLVRPSRELSGRITAAGGYSAPSILSGAAEIIGLQAFVPTAMNAERIQFGELELTWTRNRLQIRSTASATRITRALQVVRSQSDTAGRLRLANAAEPTRVFVADLEVRYQADRVGLRAWYAFGSGQEDTPDDSTRRSVGWLPQHSLGAALTVDGVNSHVELRARFVGQQYVWDNPYRTRSPGYLLTDGVVSARAGRARLFVSAENLLDVNLRDYEPLLIPTPGPGGQRTITQWVPARGRVVSLGATVTWD